MKVTTVLSSLALCLAFIGVAGADTLTVEDTIPGSFWQPFPSLGALNNSTTDRNGSLAYWAQASSDGLTDPTNNSSPLKQYYLLNVGNFLTGTCGDGSAVGTCAQGAASPFNGSQEPNASPANLPWLGNGTGQINNFYFTRDSSNSAFNPLLAYTANTVEFGWYTAGNPSDKHPLLSGMTQSANLPASVLDSIPTGTNYGLYETVYYSTAPNTPYSATYFTESQFNVITPQMQQAFTQVGYSQNDLVGGVNHQHFAVFAPSLTSGQQAYFIGVEDSIVGGYEATGDYQDTIVSLVATPQGIMIATPEPSALLLTALGAIGLFFARRGVRHSAFATSGKQPE